MCYSVLLNQYSGDRKCCLTKSNSAALYHKFPAGPLRAASMISLSISSLSTFLWILKKLFRENKTTPLLKTPEKDFLLKELTTLPVPGCQSNFGSFFSIKHFFTTFFTIYKAPYWQATSHRQTSMKKLVVRSLFSPPFNLTVWLNFFYIGRGSHSRAV